MHKYVVFLFLLLLAPLCGRGQSQEKGTLEVGLQAGPSYTFLRESKKTENQKGDFRGAGGIFIRYRLANIALKAELLYEGKGTKEKGSSQMYDLSDNSTGQQAYTLRQHFEYLTLPIVLEVPITKKGFFLGIGPYLGYLLEQRLSAFNEDLDFTSSYQKLDAGLTGGLSYYRPISPSFTLKTEIRHSMGLLNVTRDTEELGTIKTNSTKLLVGISYIL